MQFTPQQLAGAGRFSQKTKIGNWCEDQSLTNAKLQDYLVRKAQGNLLTMEAKVRKDQLQRIVPLTHTSDGCLRFGDAVQLRSKRMGSTSALCSNIHDPVVLDGEVYATTVAPSGSSSSSQPTARSVLILEKWSGYDQYGEDGVLRYGDPFLVACHPSLRVDKNTGLLKPLLHLRSSRVSTVDYAKMSNHQLVAMVGGSKIDYAMVWEVSRVADRKYQPKGAPVRASDPIVLLHRATGTPLATDPKYTMDGEYGTEYELSCHKYLSYGKTLNMVLEANGVCTGDVGQRAELDSNVWSFETASSPNEGGKSGSSLDQYQPMSPEVLVQSIRTSLDRMSVTALDDLIAAFRAIDDRGNGVIDRQHFLWGLRDFGIVLGDIESGIVLNYFDTNCDGTVTISEFATAIGRPTAVSEETKE